MIQRALCPVLVGRDDELSALDTFLRNLPECLNSRGRLAVITFHSGEDRRVKKAFENGIREGHYSEIAAEVVRPTAEERRANPRATSAKLRWARRA